MKAITRSGFIAPILNFTTTQPRPRFDPTTKHSNQVLIQVKAASINPVDYKLKSSAKLAHTVVGFDFSGVIVKVGIDVHLTGAFEVGDEVFGQASEGSLAEYVMAFPTCIAIKKPSFTFLEAAALPVAYVVGYQGLKTTAKLGPGKEVLIIGASGGCGIAAIQIAKGLNVNRIVAICSKANAELVQEQGATEVIDYTNNEELNQFWRENSGKFDCVYDAASSSGGGEEYVDQAMTALKTGDSNTMYVQLNGNNMQWAKKFTNMLPKNVSMPLVSHDMNTKDLEAVMDLLDRNDMKPIVISKQFTEIGFKEGFGLLMSRRTKGKIVYEMEES